MLSVTSFFFAMKRKFKQWWSTIPQISIKPKTTSHLKQRNTKRDNDIWRWKSRSCLGTGRQMCLVKPFNGTPGFPFLIIWSIWQCTYMYKQAINKPAQIPHKNTVSWLILPICIWYVLLIHVCEILIYKATAMVKRCAIDVSYYGTMMIRLFMIQEERRLRAEHSY